MSGIGHPRGARRLTSSINCGADAVRLATTSSRRGLGIGHGAMQPPRAAGRIIRIG